jgi:signal transduction histidine kinase
VSLLQRLDPRRRLAAAIGWSVFIVVTLTALLAASLAAAEAEDRARADAQGLLAEFANQVRDTLASRLEARLSIVDATAAQIVASNDRGTEALRRHLEALQAQFPEFVWLGVADDRGLVVAASGGTLHGQDVSSLPWFRQARQHTFLGNVRDALLLQTNGLAAAGGGPLRVLDAAAPLIQASGQNVGVLGTYLSWAWIERQLVEMLRTADSQRQLDLLLADKEGIVLVGAPNWLGRKLAPDTDLTDAGVFVVGRHDLNKAADGTLAWTVVVRQRVETALAPAKRTRHVVFGVVFLAGLLAAVAAVLVTHRLSRRLASLAEEAEAVRRGARRTLAAPAGADEVSRIGATLAQVVDHLQEEKKALVTLNTELDARVAERTARIERLAAEARQAALTRERLRLARDLHDTLAHSLMALLTQIRLVRKLRTRLDAAELDAELGRAEDVAASGLAEARAAITQMRNSRARDAGLGAALKDLVARFGQRTGLDASLDADSWAAELADERAETVFRIVEEALRNVERHAQAREVRVVLQRAEKLPGATSSVAAEHAARVRVAVIDDGIGFDPQVPRPGHYGLRGIHEQAALIGAQLVVRSQPGQGTRIAVEFDQ